MGMKWGELFSSGKELIKAQMEFGLKRWCSSSSEIKLLDLAPPLLSLSPSLLVNISILLKFSPNMGIATEICMQSTCHSSTYVTGSKILLHCPCFVPILPWLDGSPVHFPLWRGEPLQHCTSKTNRLNGHSLLNRRNSRPLLPNSIL